jgi:gliding motility-associated-like protein
MLATNRIKIKTTVYFVVSVLLVLLCNKSFAQPIANFTANNTSGCAPVVVQFQDLSTGSPTSWKWDLGNGVTSTQQNPSATYFTPGTYNVKLVVTNAAGKDSITKNNFVTVSAAPNVNFKVSDSLGCFPLRVQFTDLSTPGSGIDTAWQWDFGDGTFSNLQNPNHTYTVAGNFTIILQVKNSAGCQKTLAKPNLINVQNGVKANFTFVNNSGCTPPAIVNFNNTSTGSGVLTYLWNFGDNTSSILQSPPHTYSSNGTFTVQLIVNSSLGCKDTLTKPNLINIGLVNANYAVPVIICINTPTVFNNTSSPAPISATWNFGDGTTASQISPTKTFTAVGAYPVKMISNFGLCKDSITKIITVQNKPTAAFSETGNVGLCHAPLTVSFSSSVPTATSYQWFFGDGGTSTLQNPTHTYTTDAYFTVTLVVTNAGGCTDTLRKVDLVKIGPPKIIRFTSLPYKGCVPYTASPTAVMNTSEPITSYLWSFTDGFTSTLPNPTHTLSTQGVYGLQLIVTTASGCKDTLVVSDAVSIYDKPVANFSATPREACAFTDIHFNNLTTGQTTMYYWSFGDGGASSSVNPLYQYTDTGYFSVLLVATNVFCVDSIRLPRYIHIKPPVANFSKSFSCDTPYLRRFQNLSKGDSLRIWNFGDGTTDTSKNPIHTYAATGTYIVTLLVMNDTCQHIKRDTLQIIDVHPDFTSSDSVLCKNANIVFNAINADTSVVASYLWLFGDATNSNTVLPTVTHTYGGAGNYIPSLITTDKLGCKDTVVRAVPVHVYGPKAGFTNPAGTCVFGTITFTDTSLTDGIHPLQQWVWNYGDSGTQKHSYIAPPYSHRYDTAGRYNVSLTVYDSYGCKDSVTIPQAVLITKPKANFIVSDTLRCRFNNILYTNQSTSVLPATYVWNFGDTTTSTVVSPTHAYTYQGLYNVQLIITDAFGCTDTITKPQLIKVADAIAKFTISDTIGFCPPLLVQLNNQSQNFTSISWNFGDGNFSSLISPSHFYNNPGNYVLTLTANGSGTCKDSSKKTIVVKGPSGSFSYGPLNICSPSVVNFVSQTRNNATFIWDFGDGTTLATSDSMVSHVYNGQGLFKPKMILVDNNGCQVLVTGPDTIRVVDVIARVNLAQTTFCDSVKLSLKDSSISFNDNIVAYKWNFGDGTTSTQQNPTHNYTTTGNYILSLIVTTALGCKDTAIFNPGIKVVYSPLIAMGGDSTACVNAPLTVNASLLRADTSALQWQWNFGNTNVSTLQNPPPQFYTTAGTYSINVVATNSSGCKDTVIKPIIIHPLPIIDAGPDTIICKTNSYTMQPSGGVSYTWQVHPSLSCTSCTNPLATPDTTTLYRVVGTSPFGCTASDSVRIKVLPPFKITVSTKDTLCVGESSQLNVSGANSYVWSPSTGLSATNIPNPIASPTATTIYQVVGSDIKNCFRDTGYVPIIVYPIPQFNIIASTVTINVGNSITLSTTNSADITKWRWTPTRWLNSPTIAQPIATPKDNIIYRCEASNDGGCKVFDEITIEVLCNGSNVYIPNTFSPNKDGVNDVFYVRGKGLFSIKSMKVFNRWGELVFERLGFNPNDATLGWDGTFKDQKLSPDVFVYVIEALCDNSVVLKYQGNVTLVK